MNRFMIIERIIFINSRKRQVRTDSGYTFPLYNSEIRKYKIAEGAELEQDVFDDIYKLLVSRAISRIFYLLESSDKTSCMIKKTLCREGYPEDIIERAVRRMSEYGYIDDRRYTVNFIDSMHNIRNKSRKEIINSLKTKGVDHSIIEDSVSQFEFNDNSLIYKIMKKKGITPELLNSMDNRQRAGIYALLARKGFSYESINSFSKSYSEFSF